MRWSRAVRPLNVGHHLVGATLLAFAISCTAAEPASFGHSKRIDRGAAAVESILAVNFDSDVYAATRPDFPDLRIFDARSREIPYLVEKVTEPRTRTVRNPCGSTVISLKGRGDGLDVLLRLDADAPAADGLNVMTPLRNYERRVGIEGSNDGVHWTPLLAGGLIFDYSRYMDIANRELRLPRNDYRQFRFSIAGIADAKESPFLDLRRKYRGGTRPNTRKRRSWSGVRSASIASSSGTKKPRRRSNMTERPSTGPPAGESRSTPRRRRRSSSSRCAANRSPS